MTDLTLAQGFALVSVLADEADGLVDAIQDLCARAGEPVVVSGWAYDDLATLGLVEPGGPAIRLTDLGLVQSFAMLHAARHARH